MKILVTGGCGFIGSHVCEYYAKRGDEPIALDNMTNYELGRAGYRVVPARQHNKDVLLDMGIPVLEGDIRDLDYVVALAESVDFVVHTAAQPAMTISLEDPVMDAETNILGTLNILEAAKLSGVPVVSCATIHVYGNSLNDELVERKTRYVRNPSTIGESERLLTGTLTPLHVSKAASEFYTRAYIDSYRLQAASYRLSGLYGPRQFGSEDHGWVANFVIRAVKGIPINVFGTGKQVRDILFCTDVAEAFDAFYRAGKPGVYNVGGGMKNSVSLLEVIDIIAELLNEEPVVNFESDRYGDLRYFVSNIAKIRTEMGWQPVIRPVDGIRILVDWVGENEDLFSWCG